MVYKYRRPCAQLVLISRITAPISLGVTPASEEARITITSTTVKRHLDFGGGRR